MEGGEVAPTSTNKIKPTVLAPLRLIGDGRWDVIRGWWDVGGGSWGGGPNVKKPDKAKSPGPTPAHRPHCGSPTPDDGPKAKSEEAPLLTGREKVQGGEQECERTVFDSVWRPRILPRTEGPPTTLVKQ